MDNVKLFRIDYRLLHWQTGVLWVQKLKANMILVAGDKVAADDMRNFHAKQQTTASMF